MSIRWGEVTLINLCLISKYNFFLNLEKNTLVTAALKFKKKQVIGYRFQCSFYLYYVKVIERMKLKWRSKKWNISQLLRMHIFFSKKNRRTKTIRDVRAILVSQHRLKHEVLLCMSVRTVCSEKRMNFRNAEVVHLKKRW